MNSVRASSSPSPPRSSTCPARQRAVLILRDVLGFSARETAETLEMTPVSVDSALQRAHKSIEQRVPAQTQQATLRALGDRELRQLVNRFADAWERNDVDAVVAMLADDARMAMPPWPSWYRGRDAIATFLRSWPLSLRKRWQLLHTSANGQPAVAGYLWDQLTTAFRAETIIVLTFQAARIEEITAFRSPEFFSRFGLPEQLTKTSERRLRFAPTPASHHTSLASLRPIEKDAP